MLSPLNRMLSHLKLILCFSFSIRKMKHFYANEHEYRVYATYREMWINEVAHWMRFRDKKAERVNQDRLQKDPDRIETIRTDKCFHVFQSQITTSSHEMLKFCRALWNCWNESKACYASILALSIAKVLHVKDQVNVNLHTNVKRIKPHLKGVCN